MKRLLSMVQISKNAQCSRFNRSIIQILNTAHFVLGKCAAGLFISAHCILEATALPFPEVPTNAVSLSQAYESVVRTGSTQLPQQLNAERVGNDIKVAGPIAPKGKPVPDKSTNEKAEEVGGKADDDDIVADVFIHLVLMPFLFFIVGLAYGGAFGGPKRSFRR